MYQKVTGNVKPCSNVNSCEISPGSITSDNFGKRKAENLMNFDSPGKQISAYFENWEKSDFC